MEAWDEQKRERARESSIYTGLKRMNQFAKSIIILHRLVIPLQLQVGICGAPGVEV